MEVLNASPVVEFPAGTLEKVRSEYNLDKKRMEEAIEIILCWAQKQNHFKRKDFDRRVIEFQILMCKGSIEKTKLRIDNLCTFKTMLKDFFVTDVKTLLDAPGNRQCSYAVFPELTKDYRRIYIMKLKADEIKFTNFLDFSRLQIIITEYLSQYEYCLQYEVIADFRDANLLELIQKMNIMDLQRLLLILMKGFSCRLIALHFIYNSKLINTIIKMVKSGLNEKLANRLYSHRTIEELKAHLDVQYLPKDYGGSRYTTEELWGNLKAEICSPEFEKQLLELRTYCTDESLRLDDDPMKQECLGLAGSFRTLTVDK